MLTRLPKEIQILIYTFDSTYHELLKLVIKQIHTFGIKKRIRNNLSSPCMKQTDLIGSHIIAFSNK